MMRSEQPATLLALDQKKIFIPPPKKRDVKFSRNLHEVVRIVDNITESIPFGFCFDTEKFR